MMHDYRKCQYAAKRRSHTGTVRGGVGAIRLLFTVMLKAALTSSPSAKLADWRTRSSSAMAAITCERIASMSVTVLPSNRVNACTAVRAHLPGTQRCRIVPATFSGPNWATACIIG